MKPTVFIHTNPVQMIGAKMSEYSLRKASRNNEKFDVRILNLVDYPHLTKRQSETYIRKGAVVTWNNRDLQSFSLIRFLPPQEMGFQGRALVLDPDIFAVADVWELLNRDMGGKKIVCRLIKSDNGKPYYATSAMLLDCGQLPHWDWNKKIDRLFAHKLDYGDWIFLRDEDPNTILELEEEWNHFDTLNEKTKLLHNTERSTQPWKTGLPVDYNMNYRTAPARRGFWSWLSPAKKAPVQTEEKYLKHPDSNQERFCINLMKECLDNKVFTEDFLKDEMQKQHVRPDVLDLLQKS
ncbi:MAG TPA: hypothetical protein VIK35_10890 [Verrucomicrobiae bacterium]